MTDLERLGRHVGEVRDTEPRDYVVFCIHEHREHRDLKPGQAVPLHCQHSCILTRQQFRESARRTREFMEDLNRSRIAQDVQKP